MNVIKRDGTSEAFNASKIKIAVLKAFSACGYTPQEDTIEDILDSIEVWDEITIEDIQDQIEEIFMDFDFPDVAKAYILYRENRARVRENVREREEFIKEFMKASNAAEGSEVDDNSNVANKNIAVLNNELYKSNNIDLNRYRVKEKLQALYPDFDYKQYERDLKSHIIYKHDENSTFGFPYCVALSCYPFLQGGIKGIGGLSASPKNLDSFCGMFVNMIFAVSSQFAGAVATASFLVMFDHFARKEWGEDYWKYANLMVQHHGNVAKFPKGDNAGIMHGRSIEKVIEQKFQQIVYSINQPAASRGFQSAFWNVSYFDKPYFEGMYGHFVFPDGDTPKWDSINWLQKKFMKWFNQERLRCMLTFPVETVSLLYKDGEFQDKEWEQFISEEYAAGHSFFTYISDSVDSLSSCCFSKDTKVLAKSSNGGLHWDTFENIKNIKTEDRKNFTIFHNGSWCSGKIVKLPNRQMYKITTSNKKEIIISDNHINPTLRGDIKTENLTTDDYLLFNTNKLDTYPEADQHLTYSQGFAVGAFIGDGSFGTRFPDGTIYDINYSQNKDKYELCVEMVNKANADLDSNSNRCCISKQYNNVYPVRISSKYLVSFIQKWTNWKEGTKYHNKELNMDCLFQSYEFRKGILDGWYNTDGGNSNRCYTTSKKLTECMELLITSLGLNSIIDVTDRTDEKVIIRGEEFNRNYPLYCVRWYDAKNKRSMKDIFIQKNNSIYFKINSIEKVNYTDDIYCFEMKNQEEPYFTLPNGIITHNCRLKNKLISNEFTFTNGLVGEQTGSKSVITLNLNRIIQNYKGYNGPDKNLWKKEFKEYFVPILERVYKYHTAYNELLWDLYNAHMLPVYEAGFINLNNQYLTIGLNGLNEAAMFLGMKCSDNANYKEFCNFIFGTIKEQNQLHNTKKTMFNTELVPAESLAVKNYNWDKQDNYWVPKNRNLYTSYVFLPESNSSILEKIKLHGGEYVGEYLDGRNFCLLYLFA